MLDHRILLVSLLAAFLAFHAAPSLFQDQETLPAASHLVPIEVEPDVTTPVEGEEI